MEKNIIDKASGSKIWGYVAMGSGLIAVVGIAMIITEKTAGSKVSKLKDMAKEELASVKEQIKGDTKDTSESFSGCGGCSSFGGNKVKEKPKEFISSSFSSEMDNPYSSVDTRRKNLIFK